MAGHSNHAANAAAWAAMRAEQAAAAEQRRAERAAAKEARREANRAAWWGRRNMEPPRAEQAEADEVARFADGMRLERGGVAYVVDHATQTTVTLRTIADGGEMVHTHKVRRGPRGQYIRPGRSRFARDIFAADMAA